MKRQRERETGTKRNKSKQKNVFEMLWVDVRL